MIVMNTLTGAVSEYDNYAFDSMADTKAGSATGLYAIGGDTDAGITITGEIVTGKPLWGDQHKKHIEAVWLSMKGEGMEDVHIAYVERDAAQIPQVELAGLMAYEHGFNARIFDREETAVVWMRYGER